jgi:hypothetical protein
MRTPSKYNDRPCGAPSSGDAVAAVAHVGWNGLFCTSLTLTLPSRRFMNCA